MSGRGVKHIFRKYLDEARSRYHEKAIKQGKNVMLYCPRCLFRTLHEEEYKKHYKKTHKGR